MSHPAVPATLLAACLTSAQPAFGLTGMLGIHDPSAIVKCDGKYYVFGTGRGIPILSSTDGFEWQRAGRVFERIPDSVKVHVPKNDGVDVWAPEISHFNGRYHLYYSVSSWGEVPSAVGLVTNPTLNPAAPDYQWTDRGTVVFSAAGQHFNAIDPGVLHAPDGRLWLCYGSYLGTVELVELDPRTGLRIAPDSPVTSIASASEAANLLHHDGFYYLFVNHGSCCAGLNSTYHIRVGRAKAVTGPYLDRHGEELLLGAGSLFLASAGNQVGPGHFSRFGADGVEKFSIHYEGEIGSRGRSFLAIRPLLWSADGWPLAGEIPRPGIYQLCSQRTGEVLQAPPDAARVGPPQTAAYLCRDHQRWTLTAAAGGRFRITNTATGAALQAAGGGKDPRRLTLAKVAENDQQLWQIDQLADGAYRIATSDLQFVIATATGPQAGHRLTLEPFTGNAAQRWLIRNP